VPISAYFKGHGREVLASMRKRYGARAEQVFYKTANKLGMRPGGRKGVIRRRPRGSGPFTDVDLRRGYKEVR
jgi:hypothetical protein